MIDQLVLVGVIVLFSGILLSMYTFYEYELRLCREQKRKLTKDKEEEVDIHFVSILEQKIPKLIDDAFNSNPYKLYETFFKQTFPLRELPE